MAHRGVSARSLGRRAICFNRFVPHSQTREYVRRHMQRVGYPWRDIIVKLGCSQAALSELRIIVGMDQVMNDSGMVRFLFPELFQYAGSLKLFRQARVVR